MENSCPEMREPSPEKDIIISATEYVSFRRKPESSHRNPVFRQAQDERVPNTRPNAVIWNFESNYVMYLFAKIIISIYHKKKFSHKYKSQPCLGDHRFIRRSNIFPGFWRIWPSISSMVSSFKIADMGLVSFSLISSTWSGPCVRTFSISPASPSGRGAA